MLTFSLFQAVFLLVLLGWVFLPVYIVSGVRLSLMFIPCEMLVLSICAVLQNFVFVTQMFRSAKKIVTWLEQCCLKYCDSKTIIFCKNYYKLNCVSSIMSSLGNLVFMIFLCLLCHPKLFMLHCRSTRCLST